jgi:hypothetical protein
VVALNARNAAELVQNATRLQIDVLEESEKYGFVFNLGPQEIFKVPAVFESKKVAVQFLEELLCAASQIARPELLRTGNFLTTEVIDRICEDLLATGRAETASYFSGSGA